MKKTIILSVIALVLSLSSVQANAENFDPLPAFSKVENASPFHLSIVKGDMETVKKLIELGSNVNEKWNGMTPAMYAARYNKVEILQLLIDNGANLKTRCSKGHTAAYYAELAKATEAKQLIIETLSKKR
ncbi:MAG TPA: ankyrin repeat domain-containing protein [Flavobacteriaceae bacterium]|nr:ankyrin repeat domain-containing protein [Flavobacteriaceae bacterium]